MEPRVVPFEVVHPRETWPWEPCERCGVMTVVRPDHPGLMMPLCAICHNRDNLMLTELPHIEQ